MKKFTSCIRSKANSLALRARMALSNQRGDFYISDAVKIIIAVVLGRPAAGGPDPHLQRYGHPPDHAGDRGPVRRGQLRACSLKCRQRDQLVDIHSWSPLFYFLKKRLLEVEDENILQILFLSAGRPWELAQCHLCQLWLRCLYVWLGEALFRIPADSG